MTFTDKELELIAKMLEELVHGFWCANEIDKEYTTKIETLKLSEEEFETFLELLEKIFCEEDFEYLKELLGFFIYTSWEL